MLVDPVAEGIRLDLHPEVLVSTDVHALGGSALGTPGHQPGVGDLLRLGAAIGVVLQQPRVRHLGALNVLDVHLHCTSLHFACDSHICMYSQV